MYNSTIGLVLFSTPFRGTDKNFTMGVLMDCAEKLHKTVYKRTYEMFRPVQKAAKDPEIVDRGADGQYWLCLRDLELLYEGHFELLTGHAETPLTHLYEYVYVIESLYPETRPNSSLPGILNLSSAQIHTVYLWIAVHRYVLYLADPANADVKKLLDEGVACEKAFPRDVYPALTGQALYRSTEALEYRGRASNGHIAELTWAQVVSRDLSEALAMSEELVATVEKGSNEEEKNGASSDSDSDEEENGKLSFGVFLLLLYPDSAYTKFGFQASSQALDNASTTKKRKRSVKLNRLVVKASSSTKRVARPVTRVQPDPSLSQTSPTTTVKLKFPPKRPPPRPHKAFLQEEEALEATDTCQEDDHTEGVAKGSNSELHGIDPEKSKGGHEDPGTESTVQTAKIGTPSSPKHACQGEEKEKEGAPVAAAPGNLDCEKDEAVSSSNTITKVAPSEPPINSPSQPLKFAPKQTSKLCRKKANIPEKVQTTEQEK